MSGSTVGGVIGGAIGFMVGGLAGAQWGWMIGSAVGGYVDPMQVEGPRLHDARTTTSRDGIPIPFGYGTYTVAGNVIWQAGIVEHKDEERQGKGGGPEVTTYTYTRSYAVGICEGPITGILQVKRNGKIVYDARDDETLEEYLSRRNVLDSGLLDIAQVIVMTRAWNARFARKATFYLGDEEQLPDPTMEGYLGVGNVPAHRGMAYLVVEDDDVTDLQGAIPQFEFVVVSEGTEGQASGDYEAIRYTGHANPWVENAHTLRDPRANNVEYEYGYIPLGLSYDATVWGFETPKEAIDSAISSGAAGGRTYAGELTLRGWQPASEHLSLLGAAHPLYPWSGGVVDANDELAVVLSFSRYPAEVEHDGSTSLLDGSNSCPTFHEAIWSYSVDATTNRPAVYIRGTYKTEDAGTDDGYVNCMEGGVINGTGLSGGMEAVRQYRDFSVLCRPVKACGTSVPLEWSPVPDSPGTYVDEEGGLHVELVCTEATGTFKQLAVERTVSPANPAILTYPQGPIRDTADPDYNNQAQWEADYAAAVAAGTMPAGWAYNSLGSGNPPESYPVLVTEVCECVPITPTIAPGSVPLSTIVANLCEREGLTSDEYDVSQLTDLVPGFRIANEGDAASAIAALMPSYFFDCAEWDGKVRFIKRGGESVFSINGDDLVERDGDAFERERVQEAELLRRVTVGYIDPEASYSPTTQKWERRVGTVQAKGEASAELPLTLTGNTAATIAKRRGLTAWGEPEKQRFSLPYRLAALTPTDIGTYTDADGEVHYLRIMQTEDDSGIRHIESSTNCAEAYGATATGAVPVPPPIVLPALRGPTVLVPMNLDSLRAEDNVPGIYVAVCGLLPGWQGCVVEMSRDNGATYEPIATITTPARIGYLTADIGTSGEPLEVFMRNGSISSVTADQIAAGVNAFAITTAGVSEIGQAQTATAGGDSAYTLTDLTRGVGTTDAAAHSADDPFVMLDSAVRYVPLDASLAGQTLYLRAVTLGTASDAATGQEFVYEPPTFVIDGGEVT